MHTSDGHVNRRNAVRAIVERAHGYVSGAESWTQRCYSSDANAELVDLDSALARRFCAAGAIRRAIYVDKVASTDIDEHDVYEELAVTRGRLMILNDEVGREAVLAVFEAWLEKFPD